MSQLRPLAIDLAYRPESYFWAYDNNIKLASDIKGAERKAMYERAIQSGDTELANAITIGVRSTSVRRYLLRSI
jgi:hypothetical protein